jgi:hypothetical protein
VKELSAEGSTDVGARIRRMANDTNNIRGWKALLAPLSPFDRHLLVLIRVPSRKGILRTIAAMHHQRNQQVMPSTDGSVPTEECESGDVIKIKYLAVSSVRNAPKFEAIPRRRAFAASSPSLMSFSTLLSSMAWSWCA